MYETVRRILIFSNGAVEKKYVNFSCIKKILLYYVKDCLLLFKKFVIKYAFKYLYAYFKTVEVTTLIFF